MSRFMTELLPFIKRVAHTHHTAHHGLMLRPSYTVRAPILLFAVIITWIWLMYIVPRTNRKACKHAWYTVRASTYGGSTKYVGHTLGQNFVRNGSQRLATDSNPLTSGREQKIKTHRHDS